MFFRFSTPFLKQFFSLKEKGKRFLFLSWSFNPFLLYMSVEFSKKPFLKFTAFDIETVVLLTFVKKIMLYLKSFSRSAILWDLLWTLKTICLKIVQKQKQKFKTNIKLKNFKIYISSLISHIYHVLNLCQELVKGLPNVRTIQWTIQQQFLSNMEILEDFQL